MTSEYQDKLAWKARARAAGHVARERWPGYIGEYLAAECESGDLYTFLHGGRNWKGLVTEVLNHPGI